MEGKFAVLLLCPQPTGVAAVSCSLGYSVLGAPEPTAGQKPRYICPRAGFPLSLADPDREVSRQKWTIRCDSHMTTPPLLLARRESALGFRGCMGVHANMPKKLERLGPHLLHGEPLSTEIFDRKPSSFTR